MVNWRNIVPYAIFMLIVIVVFSYSSTVSSDIFLWETSSKDEWDEGVPLDISLNANPGDLILKNSPKTIEFHTISYWNFDEGEGQYAIDDSQRRSFWLVESEANWNEGTFDSLSTSVISDSLTMKLSNISIDPNTIALWPMDTGIGQTVTGIPNRDLDGTLGDSIEEDIHDPNWTEDAKVGHHALKFDTENYVEIPDSTEINFRKDDSFVIEIWFKTTMNNEMRIITKRDDMNQPYSGYTLGLNGGKVFFYLQDDINQYVLITTPKSYNNGVWHHISAVRNTSKNMVSIHIDGVEVVNATDPTSDLTNQKNLIIGATSDKSNYYFNGNLDILRIANSQMPYNLNIIYNTNGTYLSKIFGSEELVLWKKIRWIQSQISNDTNIDIMTRVSNDTVSWSGWSDPYTNLAGDEILQGISRYIQFKAELTTKVTTETPILQRVEFLIERLDQNMIGILHTAKYLHGTLGDSIEEDIHDPNWTEDAKVGHHALKFDTENYVEIPDSTEINFRKDDSFVIEIWFKTTMNNEMRIITKRDDMNQPYSGYTLGLNGGKVFFYLQDDINQYVLITTPKSYNNGVWHHISAVRNTSKNMVSIHIDGVEVVNATDPTSDLTNQKNLIIGATSDKSNYYFNGNLDILRIANSQMPYNLNIIYNTNGTYLSKIFGSEELVLWKKIRWIQSQISNDTNIDIMTRVSNDTVSWSGWSDPYTNLAGDEILQGISRYIQFKAELTTKVTTETPILRDVKINFETLGYEQEIFVKLENPPTIREGQNVILKASIKNKIGEPMSGSLITFFVNKVEIGSVLSNAEGKASIQINPSRDPVGRQVLLIEAEVGAIKNEETLLVQRAIPEILLKLENQIPFLLVIGIFLLVTIVYVYLSQPNQGKLKTTSHKILQNKEEILPRNQKNKKKEIQDNWSD